jgi:phage shock protein C
MKSGKQLRKSADNEVIDGVCGGIGEYIGIDPVFVRIAFVVAGISSFGTMALAYIVLMVLMPEAELIEAAEKPKRKNDELHYARPLDDIDGIREKLKNDN